jgi:hypothetical protein
MGGDAESCASVGSPVGADPGVDEVVEGIDG